MTVFAQWIAGKQPPIATLLGLQLISTGEGSATIRMETNQSFANPMGTLHGGILCDLSDAAMGTAWASGVNEDETFTTIELKINFFRPVWNATLTAEAHVLRRGKSVGYIECDVRDEQNRLVARAACTCMTLRGDAAASR